MPCENLEQAQIVGVELVETELRDHENPDHVRAVAQRHRQERLLDLRCSFDVVPDSAVRCVPCEKRFTGLRDVPRDSDANPCREHVQRCVAALREVAAKRDRAEVVSVAEEDAAVVVVDQLTQLVGNGGADLVDLEQSGEPARDAVEHLQVGERADVRAPRSQRVGPLALVLVEDDDAALPARLGGHHRELRAGDELAWVRSVLGADRDPDRERQGPDGIEFRQRDPLRHPFGECLRDVDIAVGEDDRELLAARAADVVILTDGRTELGSQFREHLVADGVAVDVVDSLEVVEVEHHECDGAVLRGGSNDLSPEALVECPVVPETGQRIRLRLELEAGTHLGVVESEGRRIAESHGELELVLGELPQSDSVDVERALDAAAGDERYGYERLRIGRGAFDESNAWVEIGTVREDWLAVLDGPSRDALSEAERLVRDHFVGVLPAGEDAGQLARHFVGLVEREVVVGNEVADGVGDALEERIEGLLREDVMEDIGQSAVRLDEGERVGRAVLAGTCRDRLDGTGVRRRSHGVFPVHRREGNGLEAPSSVADPGRRWETGCRIQPP